MRCSIARRFLPCFLAQTRLGAVAVSAAFFAACGGGGGSASPSVGASTAVSTATPVAASTFTPQSLSTQFIVPAPGTSPVPFALPTLVDASTTVTLPVTAGTAGSVVTITHGTTAPAGSASLTSLDRRSTQSLGVSGIVYIGLLPAAVLTMDAPGFAFTLGPAAQVQPTDAFYLAYLDPSQSTIGYQTNVAGPIPPNGNVVTFPARGIQRSFTLRALLTYLFVLYRVRSGSSPPPIVTPAPASSPAASPSSIALLNTNTSATFTVTEAGYSGGFTATSNAPGVAAVSPAAGNAFTVTAAASGNAIITVIDANGNAVNVPVQVTVTIVPVQ